METRFANALEALKAYEQILELDPQRQDVLDKLKDLYEKRRDFENLIRVRRMEADRMTDPRKRAEVLVELAVMATERLRKIPAAIELWETVLGIDDSHGEALRSLEGLYEREKNVERQCAILKRRIDLATVPADQVQLLEKLAGIQGTKLSDSAGALATWKRILEVQPGHDRAKRELRARFLTEHRWEDLDWFIRKFGTVDELARTLESQVGSIQDSDEKVGLLFTLAAMWRDELNQPTRAVKDLEAVLQVAKDDRRAAVELIALYRGLSDWRRLPAVYDIAIAKTDAGAERRRLLIEAAEVYERHLSNAEAAFFAYIEAFKEDLLDDSLREELERLAGPSHNWDTYVAVLEMAAPILPDEARKVATWLRVGQIHYEQLRETEPALAAFRHALDLEGDNRVAIAALEAIYREQGDFENLAGILRLRLDLERRREERLHVRFDLAAILYAKLRRVEEAIGVYNQILSDHPDEAAAYQQLSDLLTAEKRFEELLDLLTNQVGICSASPETPEAVMADLYCRIGMLSCALHGPTNQVVKAYAKSLSFAPLHPDAVELLSDLLGDRDIRLDVVDLLSGPYEKLGRWADLADLIEIELMERGDGIETVPQLWRLNELYDDRARDDRKAFRTLARILAVTPDDERVWDRIERSATILDAWRELSALYETAGAAIADGAKQVALRLRLARIFADRLGNVEHARRVFHEILAVDDSNKEALDALEAIYEAESDHAKRLEIYRRQYEVSPYAGEKISYAFKMAGVLADNLDDVEGGIRAVKLILEMDPEYESAWRYLDSLYSRAERWFDLAQVLRERVRLSERELPANQEALRDVVALKLRLAEVTEERIEDTAAAVDVYASILDVDAGNDETVHQLERLFAAPAVRVKVAPILLAPYQSRRDFAKLVEVYDVLAEAADHLDGRLGHYDTIARIYEQDVTDLDMAFRYRARAFRAAPEREELVAEVLRVGGAKDGLDEAILTLCEKVFDIGDEERRRETHRTIARVCRDSGVDRDLSKRHYTEVLLMDPADMDALDSLIALHREDDEVAPLVGLILRKADLVSAAPERADLLLTAGDLYAHRLARPDDAIRAYGGVLDIEPANTRAIEALEDLYGRGERWEDLVEVLGRKAGQAATDATRISALRKKGLIQHEKMGSTSDAIETFLEVLAIDPTDLEALRTLDRLYAASEDWMNLYETLGKLLAAVPAEERLTIHYRMGRLLERELSDANGAVRTYADILEAHPDNRETVDALEGMVRAGEAADEAFRVLAPALSERGEWERLFVVYEVVTEREEDLASKVTNLMTMGGIAEDRMGEPLRSFECYGRAFTADPRGHEALEKLETIAAAHDMWENVPTLMLEAAKNIEGTPEALTLRLRAGDVQRDRLEDREVAARTFEAVVADFPDNAEALRALNDLYTGMERYQDLARVLRAQIEASPDADAKVRFLLALGNVAEDRLANTRAALDARREVLYLSPADVRAVGELRRMFDAGRHPAEILELLEPIYRDGARWEDLATVYEAALPATADAGERKAVLLKLGDTWLEKLGRREIALGWMGKALAIEPSDESLLVQVEVLAAEAEAWGQLLDILLDAASASSEDERRVYLWHKAAECSRDRLGNLGKAESVYRWVLDVDREDRKALAALDAMYEGQGRWADLLHVLERECDVAEYDDDRIAFYLRAGALQRDRLGDADGAVEAYRAVTKMDENHRGALTALSELHESRGEQEALYKVLATLADIADGGEARAVLLRRMARIAEVHLGQKEGALGLWEEISRIRAEDTEALRELERLYADKQDWTSFVDTCERELPLARDDTGRVTDLLRLVARAAEDELADGYQAQQAWRRILDVAPSDVEAMQALRRLYRDSGDVEGLSAILDRLVATGAFEGGELQGLLEEHARLLTDELPRPERAIERWNDVLGMQPDHGEALETVDRLYEDAGRIAECVEIVKRRAALAKGDDQRAALLMRAADLEADRLKDLAAAASTLEDVATFAPANLEVSERLQGLYTRLSEWDRLAEVLLRRDKVLTDVEARVANLAELARVYEDRKDDREAAFLILTKSAEVNPADENTLADLWRVTQAISCWTDYVDSMAELLDRMPDGLLLEHLVRCGEVTWKKADRAHEAVRYYVRVIEKWPEHETSLVALTELYSALAQHEELVRTLETRVELTPDYVEKVQLQLWAGRVLDKDVRDGARAIAAYTKVLEFDEGCLEALDALAALRESRREWEELIKVLKMIAPLVPDREVQLRLQIGSILEGKLDAPERAIQAFEEVVSIEATNAIALDRLQALYGALNNWRGLADVYERLLDLSTTDPDRILFCQRLAMLSEEALGDKRRALEYDMRILDLDPSDDEVFEACARLLTELEDWNELINLYESRVSRAPAASKVATLIREAEVYEHRMGDANAAVSVHQRVLEFDASRVASYSELARLFGQMESWEDVVNVLMKWKEHVDSDHEMVELILRAATIVKDRLENPDRALKLLGDVRRMDPGNEAACEKMRLIHAELEDWERVAEVYLSQEPHIEGDERKAGIRSAAGDVFMTRLKDRPRAIQHYEKALELNPNLRDVALSLAKAYVATESWEKAEPLLDMLLKGTDLAADPARAAEIHFQVGLCAEKLLDFDRAFREYQVAIKLRGEHGQTILGLGRLYQRKKLWQLAKDHFEKALAIGGEDLGESDVAATKFALGEVSLELNELDDAIRYLDEVEEAGQRLRAIQIQIQIAERKGDWSEVIRYKQAMIQAKTDPYERFAVLLEIGDIYRSKLGNVYGATQTYREALSLNPDAKVVLLRLFEMHLESGAIEDALYALERLAQAEDSPEKRAVHYVRMAALYQEKLHDDAKAIEHLNLALDADPDRLEAFRAIDEILTHNRDWEAQAEAYRHMLERLKSRNVPELEYRLYANLGEIYRSRLKRGDYAISAYSMAAKLRPEERRVHEILAQLYEMTGDQMDRAVDEHRAIVLQAPLAGESSASYKAMRRIFLQTKEFDKAFVVSSVLAAIGQADPSEAEFFEGNLEPGLPWFKGTIDQLRWESHLMSRGSNATLGRILQVMYQGLGVELGAKELKDLGLRKKNEMDLDQKLLFANVYKAVAKALGPLPHKVYRDESPTGLRIEFVAPPALVVGTDMLTGHEEREVAFLIGRQLAYLHPMHFLASVKNLTELKVFLAAVLKFCRPQTQITTGAEVVTELVKLIERRMPQQQKNQLGKLVDDLAGRKPDLDFGKIFEEQFQSMERTALRAGLLVAGNVGTAFDILKVEETSFSGMSQRDRMEEVVRFAVSEDHFVLRRALGVAVEGTGA
jgi:tetratricopeptide (TPR) repeat protein